MSTKKITYTGLLLALAVVLPQAFHLFGPNPGGIFLPMHIPVLIAGYIVGPVYGLIVGILAPILSSMITGMPPAARLPFMIVELAGYGLTTGLLYQTFKLKNFKFGVVLSLIGAMIVGRVLNIVALLLFANAMSLNAAFSSVVANTVTGLPGIVIQLVLIPLLIILLKRNKKLD